MSGGMLIPQLAPTGQIPAMVLPHQHYPQVSIAPPCTSQHRQMPMASTSWNPAAQQQPIVPIVPNHLATATPSSIMPPTAGRAPPPPAQPQLHALYTITCEAAAMAAAAAAAAGYHVSLGPPCDLGWPTTVATNTSINNASSDGSSPNNDQSGNAGTSDVVRPPPVPLSGEPVNGGGGEAARNSVATTPPNNISAAIDNAVSGGHDLFVHIHPGDSITLAVGNEIQHISGPATIRMVSQSAPPAALPINVPPGRSYFCILVGSGAYSKFRVV